MEKELLFRRINEEIDVVAHRRLVQSTPCAFLCECSRLDCTSAVELAREDYEAVRARPDWFLVLPGHVDPEIERIVEERPAFWVLEKRQLCA
jgi:hypothetical protein